MDENDENLTETQRAMLAAKRKQKEEEEKWFEEYMEEVAERREKENQDLEELMARIEERRRDREDEDAQRLEFQERAAESRKAEEEEKKHKQEEAKHKKDADRAKKQALMAGGMAAMTMSGGGGGRAFTIEKKEGEGDEAATPVVATGAGKSKDEFAASKAAAMEKYTGDMPGIDSLEVSGLRARIKTLHDQIIDLESAKYDFEERKKIQDMDFKELQERKKQKMRSQAKKMGLDPEQFANAKYKPKIKTANDYDRVIDGRSFGDRRYYYLKAPPGAKSVMHGSGRPPNEWGKSYNAEEIQMVRKHLEENPPKYQELEPVEGAKPPAPVIAMVQPPPDPEPEEPKAPAAAAPPPAAAAAEEEEE
eukprot:410100_1